MHVNVVNVTDMEMRWFLYDVTSEVKMKKCSEELVVCHAILTLRGDIAVELFDN